MACGRYSWRRYRLYGAAGVSRCQAVAGQPVSVPRPALRAADHCERRLSAGPAAVSVCLCVRACVGVGRLCGGVRAAAEAAAARPDAVCAAVRRRLARGANGRCCSVPRHNNHSVRSDDSG